MFRRHHRPEPGPQLTPWGFYARPPAKSHDPLRVVAIGLVLSLVLLVGGCLAAVGGLAQQVGTAFQAAPAPVADVVRMEVQEGEAFVLAGFRAAAGWKVATEAARATTVTGPHVTITGLEVTNTGDSAQMLRYAFIFRGHAEWLAEIDCFCPAVLPGQAVVMQCRPTVPRMPFSYDAVVVADGF
ncbi:hypothetical protein [Nocardioides sp.]|uniref:hypothetical protein n=1 Tax=Nocardioides sp. TaxID=35761 RepID=UPI002616AC41|nr:hypothetical protein [Nocardioides sp.]MDI6909551.1 hypothetical protein [Nocardioides sp.]